MKNSKNQFKRLIALLALVALYVQLALAQSFKDNLAGDVQGNFPSQWDLIQGSAEIASLGGQSIIYFSNDAIITPKIGSKTYLSEVFTLEFDAFYDEMKKSNQQDYRVSFWDGPHVRLQDKVSFFNSLIILMYGSHMDGRVNGQSVHYQGYQQAMEDTRGVWRHISIKYNKGALKVYINDFLSINIPKVEFKPTMISIGSHSHTYKDFIRGIKNISITGLNSTSSDTDTNTDSEADTESDTNADTDSNSDVDTNSDSDVITEEDSDIASDTETDSDVDSEADANDDADANSDTDLGSDTNTNAITNVQVSTLAGSVEGFADGTGSSAKFYFPHALATDANGNVYVQDVWDHKIRKITPNGAVSTFAGSSEGYANGSGSSAKFNLPYGIAVDKQGIVYVADSGNNRIRKITSNGTVSTLAGSSQGSADGSGSSAKFNDPYGVAVDTQGNLYVSDMGNHKIRKITPNGAVSTLAGSTKGFENGSGSSVKFNTPTGVAVDSKGNVYVADAANHKIRKITPTGVVTTFAGSTSGFLDGTSTQAKFNYPNGITIDAQDNVYVADNYNNKIRKITPTGVVSTLVGSQDGFADGSKDLAKFNSPYGMAVDKNGNLYVADTGNHKIRKITQN